MPQTDQNMKRKSVDWIDQVAVSSGCARWVLLPCNTVACNTFGNDARQQVLEEMEAAGLDVPETG